MQNVVSELTALQLEGRTISLRYKRLSFDSISRSATLGTATSDALVIMQTVKELLVAEGQPLTVRLLGVAVSNLSAVGKSGGGGIDKVRFEFGD